MKRIFKLILFVLSFNLLNSCTLNKSVEEWTTVKVENGSGNLVECSVFTNNDVVNLFKNDYKSYSKIANYITRRAKYECTHPRTFIPEHIFISDLIPLNSSDYKIIYSVGGSAQNSFGVEGSIFLVDSLAFEYEERSILLK